MRRRLVESIRRLGARIEPPPRLVDWSILVVVCFEALSGLYSFTIADPEWWPLWWAHRIAGLTLVILLAFKLARVAPRLTNRTNWNRATPVSIITLIAAAGAIATGALWVFGTDVRLTSWTLLSIHVGFGLALVPLVLLHLRSRIRLPRRTAFDARRTTLQYATMLTLGLLAYRGQELVNHRFDTPGARRRFTGSQPHNGDGNDSFPVTAWVADDPDPIDPEAWTLIVRGAVTNPLDLDRQALDSDAERDVLLDCTSGWYTEQRWRGIAVGDLLDAATVESTARYVRFVSVTGYRWTLPIEEARSALLATHVGGERLTHGHGAPLRLVAPGRRGFQWVKWIHRIDVRENPDPGQWLATLVSGFDD